LSRTTTSLLHFVYIYTMNCCKNADAQVATRPTVLILGAGFGGLGTAKELIKNGGTKKYNVILVDTKDYFTIGGLWQFVWNDRLTMDQVKWPLKDAYLPGVQVKTCTTVRKWEPADSMVTFRDGKTLKYDHIVLACGVVPDHSKVPGMQNHLNICTESTVLRQKLELKELIEKAKTQKVTFCLAISSNPYKCPPAPFELAFIVDETLRNANVRDNVRVCLVCPVDWPMPPVTQAPITKEMTERNIEFISEKVMTKIEGKTLHFKSGDTLDDIDLLWTTWSLRAPDFVKNAVPLNPKGFVTVESKITNTIPNVPNGYVIGDCCAVPFGNGFALPKAGEFAWRMGKSVADALMTEKVQSADRAAECTAEAGFNKGFILKPNFSDVCNIKDGKPKMEIIATDKGTDGKIAWANEYLKEIFADKNGVGHPTLDINH
jgi:sulfide:quinone oxidoreductase